MYRIIVTTDNKYGYTSKQPLDFTDLDKAFSFIKEDQKHKSYREDVFIKYELFQLRKDVKTP